MKSLILPDLTREEILVMINEYLVSHYTYYVMMDDVLVDISNVLNKS
jgi:hypothetical protein